MWNIQKRQIYRDRLWKSGGQELDAGVNGEWLLIDTRFLFLGGENALGLVVMMHNFENILKTTELNT